MDRRQTRIYFIVVSPDGTEFDGTVMVDKFIELFEIPLQKAIDNNTEPMDEIRAFDPENKLGYNELIV
jgi:hypothetical protein